jgi:hypothetical protein
LLALPLLLTSEYNIGKINIASRCITVPSKHGVYRSLDFDRIRFVDATYIHPEMLDAMTPGLFCAKLELLIASLILPSAIDQVSVGNLFGIWPPSV